MKLDESALSAVVKVATYVISGYTLCSVRKTFQSESDGRYTAEITMEYKPTNHLEIIHFRVSEKVPVSDLHYAITMLVATIQALHNMTDDKLWEI